MAQHPSLGWLASAEARGRCLWHLDDAQGPRLALSWTLRRGSTCRYRIGMWVDDRRLVGVREVRLGTLQGPAAGRGGSNHSGSLSLVEPALWARELALLRAAQPRLAPQAVFAVNDARFAVAERMACDLCDVLTHLGDRQLGAGRAPLAMYVVAQLASQLARINSLGWAHSDVSPGNLLVGQDGTIALGDCSLATRIDGPGASEQHGGTPPYAAPEIFSPAPIDARYDTYAVAMVGLHAACGPPRLSTAPWPLSAAEAAHEAVLAGAWRARVLERPGLPHPPWTRFTVAFYSLSRAYPSWAHWILTAGADPDPAGRDSPAELGERLDRLPGACQCQRLGQRMLRALAAEGRPEERPLTAALPAYCQALLSGTGRARGNPLV